MCIEARVDKEIIWETFTIMKKRDDGGGSD